MKNLTSFIFARGGSKGVLKKNIREVNGKPLIGLAIESALMSRYISTVVVSTDDDEIADISRHFGGEVLKRPSKLATDTISEIHSWRHAIEEYAEKLNLQSDLFISLPATSPLRHASDIDRAIEHYNANEYDIVFTITEAQHNPYLTMVKVNENDLIELLNNDYETYRRQDAPRIYEISSCIYVSNTKYINVTKRLIDGKAGYIKIAQERALDIDTEFDLHIADLLIKHPFIK